MNLLAAFRSHKSLSTAIQALEESHAALKRLVADLEADGRRIKDEWSDHHDYVQRAVGRFESRERHDKKVTKHDAVDEAAPTDINQAIRDGTYASHR